MSSINDPNNPLSPLYNLAHLFTAPTQPQTPTPIADPVLPPPSPNISNLQPSISIPTIGLPTSQFISMKDYLSYETDENTFLDAVRKFELASQAHEVAAAAGTAFSVQQALLEYQQRQAQFNKDEALLQNLDKEKPNIEAAGLELMEDQNNYNQQLLSAQTTYNAAIQQFKTALQGMSSPPDPAQYAQAVNQFNTATANYNAALQSLSQDATQIQSDLTLYSSLANTYNTDLTAAYQTINNDRKSDGLPLLTVPPTLTIPQITPPIPTFTPIPLIDPNTIPPVLNNSTIQALVPPLQNTPVSLLSNAPAYSETTNQDLGPTAISPQDQTNLNTLSNLQSQEANLANQIAQEESAYNQSLTAQTTYNSAVDNYVTDLKTIVWPVASDPNFVQDQAAAESQFNNITATYNAAVNAYNLKTVSINSEASQLQTNINTYNNQATTYNTLLHSTIQNINSERAALGFSPIDSPPDITKISVSPSSFPPTLATVPTIPIDASFLDQNLATAFDSLNLLGLVPLQQTGADTITLTPPVEPAFTETSPAAQALENQVTQATNTFTTAESNLLSAQDAYNSALQSTQTAFSQARQSAIEQLSSLTPPSPSDPNFAVLEAAYKSQYAAIVNAYNTAVSTYNNAISNVNTLATQYSQATTAYNTAATAYNLSLQNFAEINTLRFAAGEPPLPIPPSVNNIPVALNPPTFQQLQPVTSTLTPTTIPPGTAPLDPNNISTLFPDPPTVPPTKIIPQPDFPLANSPLNLLSQGIIPLVAGTIDLSSYIAGPLAALIAAKQSNSAMVTSLNTQSETFRNATELSLQIMRSGSASFGEADGLPQYANTPGDSIPAVVTGALGFAAPRLGKTITAILVKDAVNQARLDGTSITPTAALGPVITGTILSQLQIAQLGSIRPAFEFAQNTLASTDYSGFPVTLAATIGYANTLQTSISSGGLKNAIEQAILANGQASTLPTNIQQNLLANLNSVGSLSLLSVTAAQEAYSFQNTNLFTSTLAANLALGIPGGLVDINNLLQSIKSELKGDNLDAFKTQVTSSFELALQGQGQTVPQATQLSQNLVTALFTQTNPAQAFNQVLGAALGQQNLIGIQNQLKSSLSSAYALNGVSLSAIFQSIPSQTQTITSTLANLGFNQTTINQLLGVLNNVAAGSTTAPTPPTTTPTTTAGPTTPPTSITPALTSTSLFQLLQSGFAQIIGANETSNAIGAILSNLNANLVQEAIAGKIDSEQHQANTDYLTFEVKKSLIQRDSLHRQVLQELVQTQDQKLVNNALDSLGFVLQEVNNPGAFLTTSLDPAKTFLQFSGEMYRGSTGVRTHDINIRV